MPYKEVLNFWLRELKPADWWQKSPEVDRKIAKRFQTLHAAAVQCELAMWRESARGRLAEIIVIDQFSRTLYRDRAEAFRHDSLALALAQEAVRVGADRAVGEVERPFFYLPYMHSESRAIHALALTLYSAPGLEQGLDFERRHKAIIDRFGRYPHRNAVLDRPSTAEEREFLKDPDSGF